MKIVRKKSGFTVLELVIVLAIISIMTAGLTVSYVQFKARTRVKTAIRQIVLMQKALNNMANVCQGYPIRDRTDVTDLSSILPIIDLTECKGNTVNQDAIIPTIYPSQKVCPGDTLGSEMLHAYAKTTLPVMYHSTTLCKSACDSTDQPCISNMGENFYHAFITVPGQPCSPTYNSPSGNEFPGIYKPGWNYVLLHDNTATSAVDKPVGVMCGVALGYRNTVKIVINSAGRFSAANVPEGSGCRDITGGILPNPCPCGPWCQEMDLEGTPTGRQGCCAPCQGNSGEASCGANAVYPGIGYKF